VKWTLDENKTVPELEEELSRLRAEVRELEKEKDLLEFDLEEVKQLNKSLSLEIDRLYQNIGYLSEREP
jgi:peptidoglycan hydrolase CwlO-like protein